jgi:hypothetical protein
MKEKLHYLNYVLIMLFIYCKDNVQYSMQNGIINLNQYCKYILIFTIIFNAVLIWTNNKKDTY